MNNADNWHEDDSFWQIWGPMMFSKQRIASTPAEIDQILTLVNIRPQSHILDLCCGTGRHSLELARRGFKVTGVDRTQAYLNQAKEQAKSEGLNIEFVQDDMRNFCRPECFDFVISMFTSFGFFENQADDRKVTNNIYRSLKSAGLLLMDLSSKEILARVFRERDWREIEGVLWLEERQLSDDWSRIHNRWIMFKDNHRYEGRINLRLYSAIELKAILEAAGFTRMQAYGDLDGIRYDNQARRLVMVGHKDWKGVPYRSLY
jgi:SAM-dependent methyltransferase